ncbi:uncharacterized protein LOC120078991 [Benincasa hispida]|uniref:uncharacterized protein LOC120078991 n=1 Tax=Benincasa hispida TaxID=102211 RepID=UPI00190039A8|nr:uncharacterized protein LOC120078991 [Benincasa hispida]
MKVENQTECSTIGHLVTCNVVSKGHHVACIGYRENEYREIEMARQFKIPPHDRFASQATRSSSHNGTTNKIVKEKLTPTQLALFRKIVFGRFVDLDIIFNSPLVHCILLREVEDHRKDSMAFDLNGIIVTFTKEDFLLMTGLWWSPNSVVVRRVEGTESLHNRYLGNDFAGGIHIGTLETMYKEMECDNDMDVVKMTLVYYIELAMMGREKTRTNIDKTLLIDVEDLDYFNSMDWRNVLWERTLLGLQGGLSGKTENYEKRSKINKN